MKASDLVEAVSVIDRACSYISENTRYSTPGKSELMFNLFVASKRLKEGLSVVEIDVKREENKERG